MHRRCVQPALSDIAMTSADIDIATTGNAEILLRFFLPATIGVIVILLTFALYKWRVRRDKEELARLSPEVMRIQMEALAAEKKARRMQQEESSRSETTSTKMEQPADPGQSDEPPPLSF